MPLVEKGLRVFISYSRSDIAFVGWLANQLDLADFVPDYDTSLLDPEGIAYGISAEDEWWPRIKEMILAADVVVFVASPRSVQSPICDEEIAFTHALHKRIIPVLYQRFDLATAPPRLLALNIKINFDALGSLVEGSSAIKSLIGALNVDVDWSRLMSRLLAAAWRWEENGRSNDLLLRGHELQAATDLLAHRPRAAIEPPDLVFDYLTASSEFEDRRHAYEAVARGRFYDLMAVVRPFLEAELQLREDLRDKGLNYVMHLENLNDMRLLRDLLSQDARWHPAEPIELSKTSALEAYAIVYRFPCCNIAVREYRRFPPSQIREDGCTPVSEMSGHEAAESIWHRWNPFRSQVLARYEGGQGIDWDRK